MHRQVRRVGRTTRRVLRLPPREVATSLHVVGVLVAVELLIRWVPVADLSHLLGLRLDLAPEREEADPADLTRLPSRAQRQLRCTRRVTDRWPFGAGPCLRRSLVAGHLLRQRDPTLRLGTALDGDRIFAHAWIEIDGRPLENVDRLTAFQLTPDGGRDVE